MMLGKIGMTDDRFKNFVGSGQRITGDVDPLPIQQNNGDASFLNFMEQRMTL